MNILITGSKGQLGNEIKDLSEEYLRFNFYFTDLPELDITNEQEVESFVKQYDIDCIVNCAAYTAVDLAETEQKKCFEINAYAIKNLVNVAKKSDINLITISTDYVFDGLANEPYKENQITNPQSIYGKSKELGEKYAMEYDKSIIIRTSWLYSSYGKNFVKTMIKLGQEQDELRIVTDQIGSPTYASDLAKAILDIIAFSQEYGFVQGIYHYANQGEISWYDFTKEIFKQKSIKCNVKPIKTQEYQTPAKRPEYSVFNTEKIRNTFGIYISDWKESLKKCLDKI